MELQNFLKEALKEQFKANATVEAIKEKIRLFAEIKTFEKYENEILFKNGMEFELVAVKTDFYTCDSIIKLNKVKLRLLFFSKSKLPKEKRERLEEVKSIFKESGYTMCNSYKIPIWKELRYDVPLENILSGNINLIID